MELGRGTKEGTGDRNRGDELGRGTGDRNWGEELRSGTGGPEILVCACFCRFRCGYTYIFEHTTVPTSNFVYFGS